MNISKDAASAAFNCNAPNVDTVQNLTLPIAGAFPEADQFDRHTLVNKSLRSTPGSRIAGMIRKHHHCHAFSLKLSACSGQIVDGERMTPQLTLFYIRCYVSRQGKPSFVRVSLSNVLQEALIEARRILG